MENKLQFSFEKKAIDVRDCTNEQKEWIDKLLAKTTGVEVHGGMSDGDDFIFDMRRKLRSSTTEKWTKEQGYTIVHYKDFLRELNPYEGTTTFYIDEADDEVYGRARALGCNHDASNDAPGHNNTLTVYRESCWWGNGLSRTLPHLTKQQFMMMELPGSEVEAKQPPVSNQKVDAYIWNGVLFFREESGRVVSDEVKWAYKYNLMSTEAFKAKHPDKLKFGEWEVDVSDTKITIGCQTFPKEEVMRWKGIADIVMVHTSLKEAYEWISQNRTKLGI